MAVTEHRTRTNQTVAPVKLRNGTFSVDDRDMKRLEALARAKGSTVSGLLREAVADYLCSQVGDIGELDAQLAAIHEAEDKLNTLYAGIRTKHDRQ